MEQIIIAIDPGKEKCGVAVVHSKRGVVSQSVIRTMELKTVIQELMTSHVINTVVMGDGTSSKTAKRSLEELQCAGHPIGVVLVDERHSTDQARCRYWRENPPQGLRRLIPVTMQVPPQPVDDYVAIILAERYFARDKEE